jgi:glycosyltransferase involved in cell wall biosynthesis
MSQKTTDLESRRLAALRAHVVGEAMADAERRLGEVRLTEAVVLVCAYEEEGAIGDVLAKIPETACGMPLTTVVIVDGGEDRTAEISEKAGATTIVFPVNLGHGVALKVGYRLCIDHGAKWVVTIDADGQNDPDEIPVLLQPLVDDQSDFVVASRRLGTDTTTDRTRKLGVVVFSAMMNRMTGAHLTDTSNGYRALRTTMLEDVIDRLEQEQYQTAELLITCLKRGWRVSEVPTVWHKRQAGTTKKGSNWLFGFRYLNVVLRTWLRER